MTSQRIARILAAFVLALVLSSLSRAAEMILGDPPQAPTDLAGLPGGGPNAQSDPGGFTVNAFSREEARSFYNAVFQASEGVPMESTADVAACAPGDTSAAFKEAVLRRINWFRAMAGIPATITFNSVNNAKCQQAALLMARNDNLSHFPPPSWTCYTADGADAADSSNLALGSAGADSIVGYMKDSQANNTAVGHRRWLLYPQTQVMGTGDVPGGGGFSAANATWVFDANYGGPRPPTRTPYVAWPPAGFVPYQVVYPRWSFALPGANLSAATVTMRSNGVPVSVAYEPYATGFGENTLVWVPMGLNANNAATAFPFAGSDTVYTVAVSNITGAAQSYHIYTVTVINPAVPGADYAPPVISGPSQPFAGQGNAYTFTPVTNAVGYEWRVTQPGNFNLFDGAESGLGNFTTGTSPDYAVQDASVKASGNYSFRLAHATPPTPQTLTLNQAFAPRSNGTLTVRSRLAFAGDGETARVQISTDGVGWQDIFTQSGNNSQVEAAFVTRVFPLNAYAGRTMQLRFSYTYTIPLTYYPVQPGAVGWYLDDVAITNAEVWTVMATNSTATTNFTFHPLQATNYNLNVRAVMFGDYPLDWGPVKSVNAIMGATPVITMSRPALIGGQIQLDFTVSGAAASFKLLQADQLGAPWLTNGSATLTTLVPGSAYRFTAPVGPATRFYRVQTP